MMRIDARLPLRFGPIESRRLGEAVLLDGDAFAAEPMIRVIPGSTGHGVDCACCVPRSAAARALAKLFFDRATGQGAAFQSVLAVLGNEAEAAVRIALERDPLVSGRYRLEPD